MVLPDNSVQIPSCDDASTSARATRRKSSAGTTWTLRAGIDNVFDRRAWRESPYQFSHAYLFPLEPRTLRALAAGRPLSRPRARTARYNLRLFLDSSVGRAPDC